MLEVAGSPLLPYPPVWGSPNLCHGWPQSDVRMGHFRRYGSPTVLIDGQDVTGEGAGAAAMACRADGAPSVALIAERLG